MFQGLQSLVQLPIATGMSSLDNDWILLFGWADLKVCCLSCSPGLHVQFSWWHPVSLTQSFRYSWRNGLTGGEELPTGFPQVHLGGDFLFESERIILESIILIIHMACCSLHAAGCTCWPDWQPLSLSHNLKIHSVNERLNNHTIRSVNPRLAVCVPRHSLRQLTLGWADKSLFIPPPAAIKAPGSSLCGVIWYGLHPAAASLPWLSLLPSLDVAERRSVGYIGDSRFVCRVPPGFWPSLVWQPLSQSCRHFYIASISWTCLGKATWRTWWPMAAVRIAPLLGIRTPNMFGQHMPGVLSTISR